VYRGSQSSTISALVRIGHLALRFTVAAVL
jgi:hypothetical protein